MRLLNFGFAGGSVNMPLRELNGIFPNLRTTNRTITSEIDPNYNCVAWALRDTERWWEPYGIVIPAPFPPYYWPENIPHDLSPRTFISLFETQGFEVTEDPDLENGVEKLALYVRKNQFQHVARQLPNGRWTSKIGRQEDIEHELNDLKSHGPYACGTASIIMQRRR
jgi:hypothetical protein